MILLIILGVLVLAGLRNAGATASASDVVNTPKFLGVPFPTFMLPKSNLLYAPENNAPPWGNVDTHGGGFPGAPIIINPRDPNDGSSGGGGGVVANAPTPPPAGSGGATGTGGVSGSGGAAGGGTGLGGGQRFLNTF